MILADCPISFPRTPGLKPMDYLEEIIARILEGVRLNPEGAVGNGIQGQALEHFLDVDHTIGCLKKRNSKIEILSFVS